MRKLEDESVTLDVPGHLVEYVYRGLMNKVYDMMNGVGQSIPSAAQELFDNAGELEDLAKILEHRLRQTGEWYA